MRKAIRLQLIIILLLFFGSTHSSIAQIENTLSGEFNLAGKRTNETQYFIFHTTFLNYQADGTRTGKDDLKLYLKCAPVQESGRDLFKYTCEKFVIQSGESEEVTIPSLKGWSYILKVDSTGMDTNGQVLGIPHNKFENLVDNLGSPVSQGVSYWVYNSFIDFHAFCDIFAEPMPGGNGIQKLTRLNQSIIHEIANSEAPVNLGSNVADGSFFKNGEITLSFTGLGFVNDATCALVNFDSGESSFKMKMIPAPGMEVNTVGSSHYKGMLFINTKTFWVEKVVMDEFVLSETQIPASPNKINSAVERNTLIKNVSESEFAKAMAEI